MTTEIRGHVTITLTTLSTLTAPTAPTAPAGCSETPRLPRRDALPEHLNYRDEGCDLFASCLSCPLPRCRYDVPGGARALLNRERDREIRRFHDEIELSVSQIATHFRISRRTVFRVLQQGRAGRRRRTTPPGPLAAGTN